MKQVSDKSDKMVLVIGDTIRIKKNNYTKKWFSREYRTEKSIKEFAKAGYPVGEYEMSVDDFVSLVQDNLTTHRKFVIKKAKKAYEEGSSSIEVGRNTKRDRRKIKSKLSKDFNLEDKQLQKDGKSILFIVKESKEDASQELIEDDDW